MSEKVGGAEGTKLDDDFKEMERVSLHHFDSILRGEGRKEREAVLHGHLRMQKLLLKVLSF